MLLLLISSLPMMWASTNQKVVTGFNCEVGSNDREWKYTVYGHDGGTNGGYGSIDGRLFEFDCQSDLCFDSELERNHGWVTCGFSWKQVHELVDSDTVLVDVRTWAHDGVGQCYGTYKIALVFDSVGNDAQDTEGNHGHLGFWFCYLEQSWKEVKRSQKQVVVGMKAFAKYPMGLSGYKRIARWDTHQAGTALAYGDMGLTSHWLHLFIKREKLILPKADVKVIGSWTSKPYSRPVSSDYEVTVIKTVQTSTSDEMTDSDMNAWEKEIAQSHSVEVAVQTDASYAAVSASLSSSYGYQYDHQRNQQFESMLQSIAARTFTQDMTVDKKFTISKRVPGEPIHSNIWYFETQAISEDLQRVKHVELELGFEATGCGAHIAPNCLPGTFAPHSPRGWTCSEDWAMINPDFIPPPECGGVGEGCDWVPVHSSECPEEVNLPSLKSCSEAMKNGELCEADHILPNGKDFEIANCDGFDVFRFDCPILDCVWVPVHNSECPEEAKLPFMKGCSRRMKHGELCETDNALPNGEDFEIANCDGFNVFRFVCPT